MTKPGQEAWVDRPLWRPGEHGVAERSDPVAVEAPLQLRCRVGATDPEPLAIVMRTPGHDRELASGLAIAEGWIEMGEVGAAVRVAPAAELHPEEVGNVIDIAGNVDHPRERVLRSASSCGVCGKAEIADLEIRAVPVRSSLQVSASVIERLPELITPAQDLFCCTGGTHAAGLFRVNGELACVREDVGRHNAVDKVIGWAALAGRLPLSECLLFVSGRVSFEIVQKAVVAGIPVVAAVSAPTSLAIDVAERFRVALCGFVRREQFNVYAHSTRIAPR